MRVTVYLHPQQTVVAHWSVADAVPILTAYFERAPTEPLDGLFNSTDDVTVAVHGSETTFHSYPVDTSEDQRDRRSFELSTCLAHVREGVDVVHDVAMMASLYRTRWHGLLVIDRAVIENIHRRVHAEAPFVADIELDIEIARATVPTQSAPWMLIGRRGQQWYRAVIGADHLLHVLSSVPHDKDSTAGIIVRNSLFEMRSATGDLIDRVLLFGDYLTKSVYQEIVESLSDAGTRAGRLQPFSRVRTNVDDATKSALIAKAHVLGPLVTPVLSSVTTDLL